MSNNTKIVPISLPKKLARELDEAAERESMTRSEFLRNMLRRQLAFANLRELQQEASRKSKRVGIRTLQDAVRVVREVRYGKRK